jgi:uncharacterized repeat protein (TIGR03803 family)
MKIARSLSWLLLAAPALIAAPSFEVVHTFARNEGYPTGQLTRTADGSFWGTTSRGGRFNKGSIFRLSPDGMGGWSLAEIHSFFGDDGASPQSSLLLASDGRFYGTTRMGGAFQSGTLYRADTAGDVTTLYSFPANSYPQGDLVEAPDGMLYGTTSGGGDNGLGTVFRSDRSGDTAFLHSFSGPDGLLPNAGLTIGPDSHLYGTTLAGGASNGGIVFRLEDDHSTTTLHDFDNAADGSPLVTSLILASDGLLYGITANGGPNGTGTIFRISTTGDFEMLHGLDATEGSTATAPLFEAAPGVFLGTASFGGDSNEGTAFKFELPGTFTRLYSFATFTGSAPYSPFIDAGNGFFWTMTTQGGANGIGEVFQTNLDGSSTSIVASLESPEGMEPEAPLLQAADGNLYGTAALGGTFPGTIFRIEGGDVFHLVHELTFLEGSQPVGPLVEGADGAIYGGTANASTIVRIDPATEQVTALHAFDHDGGYSPRGGVVSATDGLLYGSLMSGGANEKGTLFRLDLLGGFTKLWDFAGPEGDAPGSPLVQGADGRFYGTTTAGGAGNGTVFVLDPDTGAALVHAFAGADGALCQSGLLEVSAGVFYGACAGGGTDPNFGGTLFEVHSDGTYSVLHEFGLTPSDGWGPSYGLMKANDGNFYGTTALGGAHQAGTVYRFDPPGTVTILYDLGEREGGGNLSALIEASDGLLYGTSDAGGINGRGTVFRVNLGAAADPTIAAIQPASGRAAGGRSVVIAGTHFSVDATAALGGAAFNPLVVDSGTILAVTPPLAPGSLNDVVVTNPGPLTATLAAAFFADFLDVDDAHPFHDFVESIVRAGITAGCGGGNYCPSAPVSRAQMAVFLLKAEHGASYVPPQCNGMFPDVTCPSPFADWIEQLANENITGGCGSGLYCPAAPVTRAQMAVFLLKTLLGSSYVPPGAAGTFGDVPPGSFAADWIEDLYARQITGGCSASPLLYCPDASNTRGQMAVFLTKTFSLP